MNKPKKPILWIIGFVAVVLILILANGNYLGQDGVLISAKNSVLKTVDSFQTGGIVVEQMKETSNRMIQLKEKVDITCRTDKTIIQKHSQSIGSYRSDQHKLLYFAIPKVGCSFWKRIFKVLANDNKKLRVFDIPSFQAHYGSDITNMSVKNKKVVSRLLSQYTSFVFVRDPFSRLFSGYMDKMFVPNPIAESHARVFFPRYRPNVPKNEQCSLNISFGAFANYVGQSIINDQMRDGHFKAMWMQCNPCDLNVTYIGKMETFMDDTRHILSSVGIDLKDVVGEDGSKNFDEANEKGIMRDIVVRTYMYINRREFSNCLSQYQVLKRLWVLFQVRGFLSIHQHMPYFVNPDAVTIDQFVQAAWKAYDRSGPKLSRFQQREDAMIEAYSKLPDRVLKVLKKAFDVDCRIFDYDCNVMKRFRPFNYQKRMSFYFKDSQFE